MKRLPLFLGMLILPLSLLFLANRFPDLTGAYRIDSTSQLRLDGATNINQFSCNCQQRFPKDTYDIVHNSPPYLFRLRNTSLKRYTNNLDCGRKVINNDLRKALNVVLHQA